MLQKTLTARSQTGFSPYSIPNLRPKTTKSSSKLEAELERLEDQLAMSLMPQQTTPVVVEPFPPEYFEDLLKEEKLILLVDLDQTLVDTTDDWRAAYIKDVQSFNHGPEDKLHFTRIRHKAGSFIRNMARHYDLYACTFGSREYATKMIKLLDPRWKYFKRTIFTREDSHLISHDSKCNVLEKAFSYGRHMVCMVDDRSDVWERRANLVRVKPFFFFKKTLKKDVFDLDMLPPLDGIDRKLEFDNKEFFLDHLQSCLGLIHRAYFSLYRKCTLPPATAEVMPYIRRKVMQGTSIVVDRTIFMLYPNENNELLAQYAAQMGAEVAADVTADTTHFISFGVGQDFKARYPGVFVVNPQWLIYSHERWERISEKYFLS